MHFFNLDSSCKDMIVSEVSEVFHAHIAQLGQHCFEADHDQQLDYNVQSWTGRLKAPSSLDSTVAFTILYPPIRSCHSERAQAIALPFGAVIGECLRSKLVCMKLPNKLSACRN